MEKLSPNSTNTNPSLIKVVLNKDFVISALIPIIIFVGFDKAKLTLIGIILSALWSISVIASGFIKERKINALAAFAGTFAVIGLVGTIISKNEKFYFIAPIIQDALLALVFFGSLLFNRSLVQVIAEQTYIKNIPDKIINNPRYQSAWRILTIAWGTLNVVQAIIRALLLNHMSMSSYFAVNTTISNISDALLIIFCIMFPKWYLLRKTNTSNAN
ncbi:VC0807 family protein [Clostridium sp. C8-1-8]|uniref:VC0807 family protein n=1 Tax=Clostridium sp. C8-1-8 TaxID=2698831 RepID=UPI001369A06D|nr:VC0807 family protein [Clostridium sp. C8-1-8]